MKTLVIRIAALLQSYGDPASLKKELLFELQVKVQL